MIKQWKAATRLRHGITWLLLVLVAIKGAELTWALLQPPAALAPSPPALSPVEAPSSAGIDMVRLENAALFGAENKAAPKPVPVAQTEVKSRLAVKLLGVVKGSDAGRSVAILGEGGQQRAYTVGDRLQSEPRAELVEILADRVVVELNGQRQYIELSKTPAARGGPGIVAAATPPFDEGLPQRIDLNEPRFRALVGDFRQRIVSDPLSFGRYVQLSPYAEEGRLQGYRLEPGRESRLFNELGLRPGDVVTQVGGIDVTDPQNIPQLMELVRSEQRIQLTIRRGDSEQEVEVEL